MAEPTLSLPGLLDLRYSEYWLLVWGTALLAGCLHWLLARPDRRFGAGHGAARSAGMALMSVPAWMALWSFVDSVSVLVDGGSVLRPISERGLTRIYAYGIVRDVGYLGVGFLLWTLHRGLPTGLRDLAARLRDEGFPMGRSGREGASVLHGYALFPLLLVATVGFNVLLSGFEALQNGDESRVWDNLTVYHVVMISLAAGFTEELVYRVLLLVALQRLLLRLGAGPTPALFGAVAVQAVVFGLAHSGYGTWSHVLLPAAFGVVAGLVAVRFGLWAAVLLHVLVDVYALGAQVFSEAPWFQLLLAWGLAVNLVVAVGVAVWSLARRLPERGGRPTA